VTNTTINKDTSTLILGSSTIAAVAGFGLSLFFVPVPEPKQSCRLYKVDKQHETAFVLKPPTLVCPQTPKCDAVVNNPEPSIVDSQTSTKETIDESEKPRHKKRRRHRIRRYWK
jgi:hypothetical protein